MEDIVKHAGIDYTIYHEKYDRVPDAGKVNEILKNDPAITHVSMVPVRQLWNPNDIESVAKVVKENGRTMIVDAMSSFGVWISRREWESTLSSACKQMHPGVPDFPHHCKQTETDRIQRQSKNLLVTSMTSGRL